MNPVDDLRFMEIAAQVMKDQHPLTVDLNIAIAWNLVSALQLATRHPHISEAQKMRMKLSARPFEEAITSRHPEAAPLLAMGWDERYDSPQGA